MNKRYLGLLVLASIFITRAEYIDVPHKFSSKAIYHKKVKSLYDFSCGYNVLWNACAFERICGKANSFSDYPLFKKTCLAYTGQNRLDPMGGTRYKHLRKLAKENLGIERIYGLGYDERNEITPLFTTDTKIRFYGELTPEEIEQKFEEARKARVTRLFAGITNIVNEQQKERGFGLVHFVCHVVSERIYHVILISLIQNNTGRALYIFDNLNERITECSHAKRYIEFLSNIFDISSKKQFRGAYHPDKNKPKTFLRGSSCVIS